VSLIESALERLRRGGEPDLLQARASARRRSMAPDATSVNDPVISVAPEEDDPTKRITINIDSLRTHGYLPEHGLERRFADHYRQIKRPLIEKASSGSEMRLILVSSALPGDGKTFTSINLAMSMARERDISVLLVDADTPRARVSDVLGVRGEPGLSNALADESIDVESLVRRTDVRGLEILPAGRQVENVTELLASARMGQVAARLGTRNSRRIVIFDSAPLLVSSEARAMLKIPGQIVLVVRAGVTPRHAMLEAIGYVEKNRLQGVILNQTAFGQTPGYYGYGEYASGDAPVNT
jgi:protein-tyrosine kinase